MQNLPKKTLSPGVQISLYREKWKTSSRNSNNNVFKNPEKTPKNTEYMEYGSTECYLRTTGVYTLAAMLPSSFSDQPQFEAEWKLREETCDFNTPDVFKCCHPY